MTITMSPKRTCFSEKKKKQEDEDGAAENEKAMWEGLNPEILALIFTRIPAEQRIVVLSLVCKSWSQCLCGPYCWADIDIEQWCRKTNRTVFKIDSAVLSSSVAPRAPSAASLPSSSATAVSLSSPTGSYRTTTLKICSFTFLY